ncbi:malate:quinone oxidoreductase [Leeuwenhoekiella sp. NPDC079379]|uniref:malate:quinone oxidoreductase n=1 Tax=Leeuwenhoekiella sp. NPDC079379 TaxID=3364122 RepID=UPI0037C590D5
MVIENHIKDPSTFISNVPHPSLITGSNDVAYLKKRFETMKSHFMFDNIDFTQDENKMKEWFP